MTRPLGWRFCSRERRGPLRAPTFGGSSLALLFWCQALTPTLIPRAWQMQAVIGAVCLAIGYGIGTLAGRGLHWLLQRSCRAPRDVIRRRSWVALEAAWLASILLGATLWIGSQNEQRALMGMPSLVWLDAILMGVVSP